MEPTFKTVKIKKNRAQMNIFINIFVGLVLTYLGVFLNTIFMYFLIIPIIGIILYTIRLNILYKIEDTLEKIDLHDKQNQ